MKNRKRNKTLAAVIMGIFVMLMLVGCVDKEAEVTFDSAGGKLKGESSIVVETGKRIEKAPACEKKGYVFCGWFDGDYQYNPYDAVTKDLNLTAKWLKKDAEISVRFDANDGKENIIETVKVNADGCVAKEQMPENPERKGYYFAGWQTRKEIKEEDLVGGVSKYMYYAGESKSMMGIWNTEYESTMDFAAQIENLTEDGEATLYARWVPLKKISNEEELNEMRNDLYGAYQLTEDIKLTKEWQPIGSYYGNYELLNENWWIHSFHGYFDGNGKTISDMTIKTSKNQKEEGANLIVEEGSSNDGTAAFFGSIAEGATVKDVTLKNPTIEIQQKGNACYAAPLVGFMMSGEVSGVNTENVKMNIVYEDSEESAIYPSVSALVGGFWGGTIRDCSAGGKLVLNAGAKNLGTGNVFFGGLSGECFAMISDCTSDCELELNIESKDTEDTEMLTVFAGGITGSNCYMDGCKGNSKLTVNVDKKRGGLQVMAAAGVGSERYGHIKDVTANGTVTVTSTTENASNLNSGSILGGFDTGVQAMIGALISPELKTRVVENCTTDISDLPFVGAPYEDNDMAVYQVRNNSVTQE